MIISQVSPGLNVRMLVEQEGIDINDKDNIYFNNLIFQNNIWNFFKLFRTALIKASKFRHTEIVKMISSDSQQYFKDLQKLLQNITGLVIETKRNKRRNDKTKAV